MNFLERIKHNLEDYRNTRGRRDMVFVDRVALLELLSHYEVMDATERALPPAGVRQGISHQLHNLITASYLLQGKNSERTLMVVMDTLLPLMDKRHKERHLEVGQSKIT